MPTAVLMGMGFTPTLAQAEDRPQAKNLTADEYKDCLKALEESEDDASSRRATRRLRPRRRRHHGAEPLGLRRGRQDREPGHGRGHGQRLVLFTSFVGAGAGSGFR
ncbi:hypothetical protein ACR6C2_32025 [Streptomyces sp. INA 01156]